MKWINASKIAAALLVGLTFAGAAEAATNTPAEIANMKLVTDFYSALDAANSAGTMAQRAREISERFISPDYVQHQEGPPTSGNAREAFIHSAESMPPGALPPAMRTPAKTVALMAEGDRVIQVTSREAPNPAGGAREVFIFNMFRIANGQLAEHWDALPAALMGPPPGGPGQR